MPGVTREINYKFSASEGNVKSVAERVRGFLKGARKGENNEAIEEIGKLAKGGGAVAGVELVTRGVENLAEALAQLHENGHQATGWEMVDVFAKGLPVVGDLYSALRKLRGELDGTNEYFAKTGRMKEWAEGFKVFSVAQKHISNLAGKTGAELETSQVGNELEDRLEEIKKTKQKFTEEHLKDYEPRIQKSFLDSFTNMEVNAKKEAADKVAKILYDDYKARERIVQDGEHKIVDMRANNRASELRILGQTLKAAQVENLNERNQQVYELTKQRDELLKDEKNPEQRNLIYKQAAEKAQLADRARALKDIAAIEADRLEKEQRRFSFAEKGLEFLKREGELNMANGDASVAMEAKKLEIINEYAKKRAELENILKKENIAPDERALLKGILGGLAGQQKRTLDQLGWGTEHFSGGLAPFEAMGHNTGLTAASRDSDPAFRIADNSDQQTALQKLMVERLEKISKQEPAGATTAANFN